MILTIRHISGSLAGKSQRVALQDGQVLSLGRAPESDIRFSDTSDDSVSSVHAALSLEGQRLFIEDKRSSNGTFVNGAPCPPFQKVAVPDGSRIQLARQGPEMQVVAEAASPAAGKAAAAATAAGGAETAASPAKEAVGKATLIREMDLVRQEHRDLFRLGATIRGGNGGTQHALRQQMFREVEEGLVFPLCHGCRTTVGARCGRRRFGGCSTENFVER